MASWTPEELPDLTQTSCIETSPNSRLYNCIAWAAGNSERWWWPVGRPGISYWPKGVPREETVGAFILAFSTLGYVLCQDASLEPGIEKVALFGKVVSGQLVPTHAALQLESGEWTSKLGPFEDVTHRRLDAVNGPAYGQAVSFLARPRAIKPGSA